MSDAPEGREEQTNEFDQQLFGKNRLAEATDFEQVPSIVDNSVRDGTLASVVGALLLWRAVRSARHGYLRPAAQAALGITITYIGMCQRHLDAAESSSTEGVTGDTARDERNHLEGERSAAEAGDPDHRRTPDEESEPSASSRNGDDRELGGDLPGEMSDPAFTADAETQGRSQPSLNADVHDPRRGAGGEELDLSETALADDSIEATGSSTERYEVSTDEGSGSTENGASSKDHSEGNDSKSDTSDEGEGGGNGDIPEEGDTSGPDVLQAGNNGDDGADTAGSDSGQNDENESDRDE